MAEEQKDVTTSLDAILELTGIDREARAYAFLYAAFRQTEVGANPVRDAIDCLIPFIVPHLNSVAGKQLSVESIKSYLKDNFGFDIPLYAIEQLVPDLQNRGYVEYRKTTKTYVAKQNNSQFNVVKAEIETEFDRVTEQLTEYAKRVGFPGEPPSGSWPEALISFFKSYSDTAGAAVTKVRGALIDPLRAENAIVANFIRGLYARNVASFNSILRIFMGVLVEEFISSVSEIGVSGRKVDVKVFYDTAVMLRLLGTSGRMLRTATEELTRYLQDLGFSIYYLSGNESEVAGIYQTIVYVKDSGKELEGETAEAVSAGEISISEIRMLQNSFPERLAARNVFPAVNFEANALENAKHQMDEKGFSAYLLEQANASFRAYGIQNREHDAGYLGTVMRLRKGLKTRDLLNCGFVFVTSNKFLAKVSRRYLIHQRLLTPQQCPPILSVGQIATIAWLMKDHKLAPEKAGRELLSNCFAAIRPDAEWFRYFREGVEKVTGPIEEYAKSGSNTLTLQAARRIAQEESFGSAALVRELNMAEILSRADGERERVEAIQAAELRAVRDAAAAEQDRIVREAQEVQIRNALEAEHLRLEAVRATEAEANLMTAALVRDAKLAMAIKNARLIIETLKWSLAGAFAVIFLLATYLQLTSTGLLLLWVLSVPLGLATVVGFMETIRIPIVKRLFDGAEQRLASRLLQSSE